MKARSQRTLARRNRRQSAEKFHAGSREKDPVESDSKEEEILEERCCSFMHAHSRWKGSRTSSGGNSGCNRSGHVVKMVNVKPPHLADLCVKSRVCSNLFWRSRYDEDDREYEEIGGLDK